jgi:ubiquitin-protein ligase
MMRQSPRYRRLQSDAQALERLAAESSIVAIERFGTPPDFYILRFRGRGLWKAGPAAEPAIRTEHEVHVHLRASYPRMMPELAWRSPVFHPNISATGVVCLGDYGAHWAPSLTLDELCGMLWDMIRYKNYDETSPYNREAAAWARQQTQFPLPLDDRPLRDKLAGAPAGSERIPARLPPAQTACDEVLDAEIVSNRSGNGDAEILYIE